MSNYSTPNLWRCPMCLQNVTKLLWHCPDSCPNPLTNGHSLQLDQVGSGVTSSLYQQSSVCGAAGCSQVLVELRAKRCGYLFQEKLKRPPEHQLHTLVLSSSNNNLQAQQTVTALLYALRCLPHDLMVNPITPTTYQLWYQPKLQFVMQPLPEHEPVSVTLYRRPSEAIASQHWDYSLYFHAFPRLQQDNAFADFTIKNCRLTRKHQLKGWLQQVNWVVLAIEAWLLFAEESVREAQIGAMINQLTSHLTTNTQIKILVVVFDQTDFFQHLRNKNFPLKNLPDLKDLEGLSFTSSNVLQDYLLYSARLLPFLQDLIDARYEIQYGLFNRDFSQAGAVDNLQPWIEAIQTKVSS